MTREPCGSRPGRLIGHVVDPGRASIDGEGGGPGSRLDVHRRGRRLIGQARARPVEPPVAQDDALREGRHHPPLECGHAVGCNGRRRVIPGLDQFPLVVRPASRVLQPGDTGRDHTAHAGRLGRFDQVRGPYVPKASIPGELSVPISCSIPRRQVRQLMDHDVWPRVTDQLDQALTIEDVDDERRRAGTRRPAARGADRVVPRTTNPRSMRMGNDACPTTPDAPATSTRCEPDALARGAPLTRRSGNRGSLASRPPRPRHLHRASRYPGALRGVPRHPHRTPSMRRSRTSSGGSASATMARSCAT